MVGVRRFNTEKALDDIVSVFWKLGYEATSVDDLVAASGLGKSSLYGAFGSKEDIFLTALEHYLAGSRAQFYAALDDPDLKTALEGALVVLKTRMTRHDSQPGCLLVLASENSESRSPQIRRRVVQAFSDEEKAFYDRLRKGQVEGQLSQDADPRALSRFFAAQGRAMAVNARVSSDPSVLDDILSISLTVLTPSLKHD